MLNQSNFQGSYTLTRSGQFIHHHNGVTRLEVMGQLRGMVFNDTQ